MPHHAERAWLSKFEVHDDGPDEALMRSMLAPHAASGTHIDPEEVDKLVANYMAPASSDDHAKHLHGHFRIDKKSKQDGGSK